MDKKKNIEIKIIFGVVVLLFIAFLAVPMMMILWESLVGTDGIGLQHYIEVLAGKNFITALQNSIVIAAICGIVTTVLAFLLAYTVNFTNVSRSFKRIIRAIAVLPMLLPTITYGFAIIYSFGRQGLLTKLFGHQLFNIYGFNGLMIGYVIYTLPVSFLLLHNTMGYLDKKFLVVSRVMGDSKLRSFISSIIRPLLGTLAASFIQCFFLSFTDFGIPAAVGGKMDLIANVLYGEMLGSVPNLNNGAVVAIVMLLPSVGSIILLTYLERYNIRYNKISVVELRKNKLRDIVCGGMSGIILLSVVSIFAVIFVIPFVTEWPYNTGWTLANIKAMFQDNSLLNVYQNSLWAAVCTAIFGTLVVYGAALVSARSGIHSICKRIIGGVALVTNTIPGMVLGIAFLLTFTGTSIQNTFLIIVLCNIVHFFSTPYLMMKSSLEKMNGSWETTAKLMGDNWIKTVIRVVTPNAYTTLLEIFSYYFVNSMVTISAIIFITGARTMVITTKIKELQHYAKFNEIFVLSLLILITNLAAKGIFQFFTGRRLKKKG